MHLKAALLATLAAAFFLTACGGGGDGGGGGSTPASEPQQSPPASEPPQSPPASVPQQLPPTSEPQQSPPATCQPHTIVGGALFVAEQGPIGVTLLSDGGGLSQHTFNGQLPPDTFSILYDNVFEVSVSNRQDKWGSAEPFPPGTPVGTTTQVRLLPPTNFTLFGPIPATFPKGIPLELWLHPAGAPGTIARERNSSSTASIGKDILGADQWKTASVTYGPNKTATVTFFATTDGPYFSVGLTNVSGPAGSGGGC